MEYIFIYWLNFTLSVFIALGSLYIASREVKEPLRAIFAAVCFSFFVECVGLLVYLPMPHSVSDVVAEQNVSLIFYKLILKPSILILVSYFVIVLQAKIREGVRYGQKPSLFTTAEQLAENADASRKVKLESAVKEVGT